MHGLKCNGEIWQFDGASDQDLKFAWLGAVAAEEAELCIEGGACGLVTCWGAKMSQTACTDAHGKTQAAN